MKIAEEIIRRIDFLKANQKTLPTIDHLAVVVPDLDEAVKLLTEKMGFEIKWHRDQIGDEKSVMKTTVVKLGEVDLALMEGVDGEKISQINEYKRRRGVGIIQHPAIRVENLERTVAEYKMKGIKFLTPILLAEDANGKLLQAFTYPLFPGGVPFFELNQRVIEGEETIANTFADQNVKSLWHYVDQAIEEGWWFEVDILGKRHQQNFSSPDFQPLIFQLLKIDGGRTRNGIVTFITELCQNSAKAALDEMLRRGLVKQTRADAFYKLTEKGEKT